MKRIIVILFLILLTNCEKKETGLEFEKKVMNEIFIDLIDSIYEDMIFLAPPPPPYPEIYYKTNNQKIKDSIIETTAENYKKSTKEFKQRIKKLKKEDNKIIIAVQDTIQRIYLNYKSELKNEYGDIDFNDSISINSDYKIDLKHFNKSEKFHFKYLSEFPNNIKIWQWNFENNYNLKAIISFSRILFDKNKEFGVFEGAISYGKLDRNGLLIFIKKENDKWIIDKITETWIS